MKELDDIRRLLGEVDGICEQLAGGTVAAPGAANEWRPVSDPPKSQKMVLISFNSHSHIIRKGWYETTNGTWRAAETRRIANPTHWSELPTWPKGEA